MGIRDIILIAIVFVSLPLSVMRPFFGLLVFSWLAYMRPVDMTWAVDDLMPTSLLVALATLVGVLLHKKERLLVLEKRTILLGLFVAAVGISALTALNPELAKTDDAGVLNLLKVVFIAVLTTGLVNSRDRARWLLLVIGGSLGLLAVKSMIQGAMNPGLTMHGPGCMIQDNNDYGLALVMALPLLVYLAREERGPFLKVTLLIMAAACVGGVLLTRSRGGVIALAVVALVWLFLLRKNGWALVVAPLAVAGVLLLTPPELLERVRNLTTGVQDASATQRLTAWEKALSMAQDWPIFGIGPGNFQAQWYNYAPESVQQPVIPHNTYLHILAESGAVTFALYCVLLGVTIWSLARLRRGGEFWRARYSTAVMLSVVGFMAGSVFLSRTHFDLFYHLVGISVALQVAGTGEAFDWFGLRRAIGGRHEEEGGNPALGSPGAA